MFYKETYLSTENAEVHLLLIAIENTDNRNSDELFIYNIGWAQSDHQTAK